MTVGQIIEILGKFDKDLHISLCIAGFDVYGTMSSEIIAGDCIDPENIYINNKEGLTIKAVEVLEG